MNPALEAYTKLQNDDSVVPIKDATKRNGEYTKPYPIGYSIFDNATKGGVRGGDLILSTGLSKSGKTTWLQNISVNLSKQAYSSLWFSFEVIIDNFYAKLKEMGMNNDNLLIYCPKQNTTGSLNWIEKKIIEAKEKFGIRFIFIDHIEFLSPKNPKSYENYRLSMQGIARELKAMAILFDVSIFLVSHVRKVYGRAVSMQDTTESGIYKEVDFMHCTQRSVEEIDVHGVKTEILGEIGTVRMLANRLTGDMPYFDYTLRNNIIVPLVSQSNYGTPSVVNKTKEEELEIVNDDIVAGIDVQTLF